MATRIKNAFICNRLPQYHVDREAIHYYVPQIGDVGLFRVESALNQYLKDPVGGSHYLFDGDLITAAFGNRYATNQYEGYLPEAPQLYLDLIARGGVVGLIKSANATFNRPIVKLKLEGFLRDESGNIVNTIQYGELLPFKPNSIKTKVLLSVGTSMDSGKTTTAANACAGLKKMGFSTAYIKLTGTAFPKDVRYVYDRGADMVCDFSDLGFPSTYLLDLPIILSIYQTLVDRVVKQAAPDYIVVEIADGLLQRETHMLLSHPSFMQTVHGVILSCGDSLGTLTSIRLLEQLKIHPLAVCGLFTASDLLIREVRQQIEVPILNAEELLAGELLPELNKISHSSDSSYPDFLQERA